MSARFLLALESTCDESAAAILRDDGSVIASAIASQESLHDRFGGVVPEIAARAHLEAILPLIEQVLAKAAIQPRDLAAVAVATEPGLPGSLMVGVASAKALAWAWQLPLVGINHIQAHIYACQLDQSSTVYPCVGLVVSGGHTNLYHCTSGIHWSYLGGTIDDAAGEAFDKVAVMLGIPFPGGPNLAKLAASGNPNRFPFPRPLIHDKSRLDFSFSGLKTAVRYQLVGSGKQDFSEIQLDDATRADVAASFQAAVIDCLVAKADLALRQTGLKRLCVGGGVAANHLLRQRLTTLCNQYQYQLCIARPELCTDNAMMGALAWERIKNQDFDSFDLDIKSGLMRRNDYLPSTPPRSAPEDRTS